MMQHFSHLLFATAKLPNQISYYEKNLTQLTMLTMQNTIQLNLS